MGRFTKPRTKVCRRLGLNVFGNGNVEKAYLKRESIGFGRRKKSEYGIRLIEKQKVMHYYGMREKQMRKLFEKARHQKGDTGRNFLNLCERRLDNVLCAAGFSISRPQARQLISHGNVLVNGRKVDIASYQIGSGDVVSIKEKPGAQKLVDSCIESRSGYDVPEWLVTDSKGRSVKIARLPDRDDVMLPVDEQLVVEFYSR